MSSFSDLKSEVKQYLLADQIALVIQAHKVAEAAHKGQKRQSGEPYITHPIAVATILATMRMDYQTIMAALLHDVLEDTRVDKQTLVVQFGEEVAELVDGVSKLAKIRFGNRAEAQAENFRKMILAMVRDIRVILVKLADRLHNMRTLGALNTEKRRRIALETLEIYAPIANRLGMHTFRLELENLGFSALYPKRYRVLKAAVRKARGNRKEIMTTIEMAVKGALEKNKLPSTAVLGREKHIYSIYKKMRNKHLSFSEIMDIYGFRVVTESVDACYRVLGAVHALYKPVPERFKDYIAIPKANGYQSLHTTLFGPYGVPIEIQIRTLEMDNIAEYGIAAHWLYKTQDGIVNTAQMRARQWLKGLLELQQSTGNSLEFIENVKIDLFPDEVYVFTPQGRILELPMGATPVDFAYSVHSDIGNSCIAAKINRRLAPLSTRLVNGQTVEIIMAPGARPNSSWLSFVVTGKARSNIRHYLKSQRRAESITFGAQLLRSILSLLNLEWDRLPAELMAKLLQFYRVSDAEHLLEEVGLGNILPLSVGRQVSLFLKKDNATPLFSNNSTSPSIAIRGTEGVIVSFADCCHPIPGDPILGLVHPGQGLAVHLEDCKVVAKEQYQTDQCLPLQWHEKIKKNFLVALSVEIANQRGTLAQLTSAIASTDSDIEHIYSTEGDGAYYNKLTLTISVLDRIHLARVIRRVRNLPAINHVSRKRG